MPRTARRQVYARGVLLLTDFTRGAKNLTGAAVEWTDADAIGMAEAIIVGQVTIPVALEWLRARGVEVA